MIEKNYAIEPDYKKIYWDLISEKFPLQLKDYQKFFDKKKLSCLDVIELNKKLFPDNDAKNFNQKHKSYDKESIVMMLKYQRDNKLNNSQLALHFNVSRNTITSWKKNIRIRTISTDYKYPELSFL